MTLPGKQNVEIYGLLHVSDLVSFCFFPEVVIVVRKPTFFFNKHAFIEEKAFLFLFSCPWIIKNNTHKVDIFH